MPLFVSKQHQSVLSSNAYDNFDSIWASEINWFEAPNYRRGGWSGVGRVELICKNGLSLFAFVKKQLNHGRLTWRHPFKGEPTFRREFNRLIYLENHQFIVPRVLFYGESNSAGDQKAILVTIALDEFQSFEDVLQDWWPNASHDNQQKLLKAIAHELKRFHGLGLVHRALYPKHIFIKNDDIHPQIGLIDLEKSRFSRFAAYRAFFDLAALNRHTVPLRLSQRMYFFKQYLGVSKVVGFNKFLFRLIAKRSAR